MKAQSEPTLDRELADLPPDLRWREWLRRIEAVLFASASPVSREDLMRVVGQGASVDLLIEDLVSDLGGRSFEVAKVGSGWMLRTRPAYAAVIRAAADVGDQLSKLSAFDIAVLAAIATGRRVPPTTIFLTLERPSICTRPRTLSARSRGITTTMP